MKSKKILAVLGIAIATCCLVAGSVFAFSAGNKPTDNFISNQDNNSVDQNLEQPVSQTNSEATQQDKAVDQASSKTINNNQSSDKPQSGETTPQPQPAPAPAPAPDPKTLPEFSGGKLFSTDDCSNNYKLKTYVNTTLSDFENYKDLLYVSGYEPYASNKIADNVFATYIKGTKMVHFYYVAHSGETRVITTNDANLPPQNAEVSNARCEESVSIVKIPYGDGLGCVYQLVDGTFILIDSGRPDNRSVNHHVAEEIIKILEALAPNPNKIIVRTWAFTHPHVDHIGGFNEFCRCVEKGVDRYKKVKIQSFLYNFVQTQKACEFLPTTPKSIQNFEGNILKYYPNAIIYKGLAGQVYSFPGAKLEILYSVTDFMPTVVGYEQEAQDQQAQEELAKGKGDGNLHTMVFRITSNKTGKVFLCTGDAGETNQKEIVARYGAAIKCDVMTVPHHGHDSDHYRARNGNKAFVDFANPKVILWPAAKSHYKSKIVPRVDE